MQAGEARLAMGRIGVASTITLDSEVASFSVLHLGGHIFNGRSGRFCEMAHISL